MLAHNLCGSLSQNEFMAKLDLQKAFDSINCQSLLHRLKLKGFPPKFLNWIKACISNIPFFVIINNDIRCYFFSSNGLR